MFNKMLFSWLLWFFLSTFFVGCNQQKMSIEPEKVITNSYKNVVEKTKPAALPVQTEISRQIPNSQPEEKNNFSNIIVIVKVRCNREFVSGATVTLLSPASKVFISKQTGEDGIAKFSIKSNISTINLSAHKRNKISENITSHIPSKKSSAPVYYLTLTDDGIVISAIIKNAPLKIKKPVAEILRVTQDNIDVGGDVVFSATTNIIENKIIFPPIDKNLANLVVRLSGENIPRCYSEKFSARTDKEIEIIIPPSVTLKGAAFFSDGTPFTNDFLLKVYPAKKQNRVYKISKKISRENLGNFELTGLAEGDFVIYAMHPHYKNFKTNVYLSSPETKLNFSFEDFPSKIIGGIVVTEFDNKPIECVAVNARQWDKMASYASCVTDAKGEFTLRVKKFFDNYFGEIFVEEPGFAKVVKQINSNENYIKIVLRQAGNITGKITNEKGTPLSNIGISIFSIKDKSNVKNILADSNDLIFYRTASDADGNYEFSCVAAPVKYGFEISDMSGYSLPNCFSGNGFTADVEPDKTSVCNLIAQMNTVIALKAVDENNKPVLNYSYSCQLEYPGFSSMLNYKVNLPEEDWYCTRTMHTGKGTFSCTATGNERGLALITNNIPIASCATNFITLIFSEGNIILSGRIFLPDGKPARGSVIQFNLNKNRIQTTANNNGEFTIRNIEPKIGTPININAFLWEEKFTLQTNLPAGATNVKLKFTPPLVIKGRVFLDNLDTPAKNFVIKENYNEQSYKSADGSFVYKVRRNNQCKEIVISTDDYLPENIKIEFDGGNFCDIGNVILKSGKTAKFHGRVVDQNDKPLNLLVVLEYGQSGEKVGVMSDKTDGTFFFENIPPGKAKVVAQSSLGFSASQNFEVQENDDLELPDLVLNFTNAAVVTLSFKLPDGSAPVLAPIVNKGFSVDAEGEITLELRAGKYSGWKMKYDRKNYIADDFEVTENTDEIEVWLKEE